jgi:hypothetical protein
VIRYVRTAGVRSVFTSALAMVFLHIWTGAALAADPSPAAGGDPRSPGEGPGLVGDPLFAIAAVLAIGLGTLIVTIAYVRLTDRRGRGGRA